MAFPNFENKYLEQAIISPKELLDYRTLKGRRQEFNVPKKIILCFNKKVSKYIRDHYSYTEYEDFQGRIFVLNDYPDIGIATEFGFGAPLTAMVIEELAAFGATNFIIVGIAGTLQSELSPGDYIICNKAIRDEGVSHHYLKHSKYIEPSSEQTYQVSEYLEKNNVNFTAGATWTIDVLFRETVAEAKQYQNEGILTAEMEAAAAFAVSKVLKIKTSAIFCVSDSLAELVWKPQNYESAIEKNFFGLFDLMIQFYINQE